jgi:hypothetical protein
MEQSEVEYDLLSDIFPLQDKKISGRKRSQIWDGIFSIELVEND